MVGPLSQSRLLTSVNLHLSNNSVFSGAFHIEICTNFHIPSSLLQADWNSRILLNVPFRTWATTSPVKNYVYSSFFFPLRHVQLFVTHWTVAHQAPPSMGFSRQEYWVGCHFLLWGILLTQGWNLHLLCLLNCRWILDLLSHWEARAHPKATENDWSHSTAKHHTQQATLQRHM